MGSRRWNERAKEQPTSRHVSQEIQTQRPVVVLCADKNVEAGLHVTLYSLLLNCSRKDIGVKIYLVLEEFSRQDISRLQMTLDRTRTFYELHLQSVELEAFRNLPSLHGNYLTYARLVLAEILKKEDKFLYLDSDLAVAVDIFDFFQINMPNHALGAVSGGGTMEWALESTFLLDLGLDKNAPYFNAGVLLFDAIHWRKENLTQQCLEFCQKHSKDLLNADQTVLNCVLHKKIQDLKECYNVACFPTSSVISKEQAECQITHFTGSPKPWDLFGSNLHNNYHLFDSYFNRTALHGRIRPGLRQYCRTLRLARSYFRCMSVQRKH